MTINYVKRYAEDIGLKNDIADFSKILSPIEGITAVSWELPGFSRREFGEKMLKDIYSLSVGNSIKNINVMLELVPHQPDTAIVKYKKTWGLIETNGINTNNIFEKRSFIDHGDEGLILTGMGFISKITENEIQKLINHEKKLFFSNLRPDFELCDAFQTDRLTGWIFNILHNNGIIYFFLGYPDEKDSELVALGTKSALKIVI